jgi:tetratricopeptide (TPR) repeat protein
VQVGRYQEAAEHLDTLLRKTPDDPDLLTLKARSQHDLGHRQEAVTLLEQALRSHPDDGPALLERARIAFAAEQFAEAEQWYRRALPVLPDNYEVHWGLYQSLQAQKKAAEADEELSKAQQLKNAYERIHEIQTHEMTQRPGDPALHAELGEMLLQTGQRDSAEYWLLSSLQLNPKLPKAHAALARLYEEQGRASDAEQHRLAASAAGSPEM